MQNCVLNARVLNAYSLLECDYFLYRRRKPVDRESIIAELEAERNRLDSAIAALQGARAKHVTVSGKPDGRRRTLTPAARRKIGLAMKKRWAERKKAAA
jgi:hypothetical protein